MFTSADFSSSRFFFAWKFRAASAHLSAVKMKILCCFNFKDTWVFHLLADSTCFKINADTLVPNCTRELPHQRCVFHSLITQRASRIETFVTSAMGCEHWNTRLNLLHFSVLSHSPLVHFECGPPISIAERAQLKPIENAVACESNTASADCRRTLPKSPRTFDLLMN